MSYKTEHSAVDALALSVRRLKAKGVSLLDIADRHGLTLDEVLALITRKIKP